MHISSLNNLVQKILHCLPSLSDRRRHVWVLNLLIDSGSQLAKSPLDELALGDSRPEEDGVDTQQDPRPFAECQCGEEEAHPEHDLEQGDQKHRGVVILLYKAANRVSQWRLRLRRGGRHRGACWSRFGNLERWDNVGPGVGRDMENRIDGEREKGERDLSRVQPHQAYY